jgi:hypothetical protein
MPYDGLSDVVATPFAPATVRIEFVNRTRNPKRRQVASRRCPVLGENRPAGRTVRLLSLILGDLREAALFNR